MLATLGNLSIFFRKKGDRGHPVRKVGQKLTSLGKWQAFFAEKKLITSGTTPVN